MTLTVVGVLMSLKNKQTNTWSCNLEKWSKNKENKQERLLLENKLVPCYLNYNFALLCFVLSLLFLSLCMHPDYFCLFSLTRLFLLHDQTRTIPSFIHGNERAVIFLESVRALPIVRTWMPL